MRIQAPEQQSDEGHTISESVPGNDTVTTSFLVPEDGTIESLSARIYPGAELNLKLRPEIVREGGSEPPIPIINTHGKAVIDGDNDRWDWDITKAVHSGDTIQVVAENTSANTYDYRINLDIDHAGGVQRAVNKLFGGVL